MKRFLTSLFASIIIGLPMMATGSAAATNVNLVPQCNSSLKNTSFCKDVKTGESSKTSPVISIVRTVIIIISYITGVAAVILIIISGIKFASSGGDSQKVSSARGSLINAMIGIAITILAQTIVVFVLNNFNN